MALPGAIGQTGEGLARTFLERRGWRWLASNWRCPMGEIDLIMQDGSTRVLVEVRLRRLTRFGQGADTVAWQKQQKLIRAARAYQQQQDYWGDIRFDVVAIMALPDSSHQVDYIRDAFAAPH